MAEGTTLERLQVIIEAKAEAYKKEIDAVKAKTEKVTATVNKCTDRIHDAINKVTTGSAGKEVDALTSKLNRQTEAINAQAAKVENLRNKLDAMNSGEARNSSISYLESELRKAERAMAAADKEMQPLLSKLTELRYQEEQGLKPYGLEEVIRKIDELNPKYDELENKVTDLNRKLEEARMNPESTADVQKLTSELELATQKLDRLRGEAAQTQERIEKAGSGGASGMERFRKAMSGVSSVLDKAKGRIAGVTAVLHKHKSATEGCRFSADKLSKSIFRLGNMFKLMLIRQIMRSTIEGAKKGFENLAQYSDSTNQSLSLLHSSLLQLQNAFAVAAAPILNAFAPALNQIVQLAVTAANAIGQLFAALTGKGTVIQAVGVNEDYAASLDKTGSAAKKAAKEIKNATLGIDELNVIQQKQDSGGGAGGISPSDMFETVEVENKYKDLAKKIKDITEKLFAPLKEAWDREGQYVMDSWKYALGEIKKLAKDIGRDFLTVWNQEETIQIFSDILHIIGDIGMIAGNLARNFRDAWNENQTGLHILENIRDIFGIIVGHIRNAADYTVEWSDKLDFGPLLQSVENFTASLKPAVDAISGTLEDFYTSVLLPLGKWTLEKGLPDLFNITSDLANSINWSRLRNSLKQFYDVLLKVSKLAFKAVISFYKEFIVPIGKWAMNKGLPALLEVLTDFGNKIDWDELNSALESFFEAISKFVIGIGGGLIELSLGLVDALSPVLAGIINGVAKALDGLFSALNKIPDTVLAGIAGALEGLLLTFITYQAVTAAIDAVKLGFIGLYVALDDLFKGVQAWVLTNPYLALAAALVAVAGTIIAVTKNIHDTMEEARLEMVFDTIKNSGTEAVSVLNERFSEFTSNLLGNTDAIKSKLQSVEDTRESIHNTRENIGKIGEAISLGAYTVDEKVGEIKDSFEQLLTDTQNIFQQEYDAIVMGLAGSLGDTLSAMGVSVPELTNLLRKVKEAAEESVAETKGKFDELNKAWDDGSISAEEWEKGMMECFSNMQNLDISGVDKAADSMDNLKEKLNFSEWIKDNALDTSAVDEFLGSLNTTFNDAETELNTSCDSFKGILDDFQEYANKLNIGDDSELRNLAEALAGPEADRQAQLDILSDYYGETLNQVQSELIDKIPEVIEGAKIKYADQSPMYKFLHSESEFIDAALNDYQIGVLAPVTEKLNEAYGQVGLEGHAWAADAGKEIISGLFDTETYYNEVFGPKVKKTLKDNYQELLQGALDEAKPEVNSKAEEVGKYVVNGFDNGIKDASATSTAVNDWASEGKAGLEAAWDINSPSRVAWQEGAYVVEGFNNGIMDNMQSTNDAIALWFEGVLESFGADQWNEAFLPMTEALQNQWSTTSVWWNEEALPVWWEEGVTPWFTQEKWFAVSQGMSDGITKRWNDFTVLWKTGFTKWWDESIIPYFTLEKWQGFGTNMKDGMYTGFKGISQKINDTLNGILSAFESGLNKVISAANTFISGYNTMAQAAGVSKMANLSSVSVGTISAYANGGFPTEGSLFIANEAGPELVGTINGRTAVAPNQSITEGIKEAAYQGMRQALSEESIGGMLTQLIDAVKEGKIIEVDGREIVTVVNEKNIRNGLQFT